MNSKGKISHGSSSPYLNAVARQSLGGLLHCSCTVFGFTSAQQFVLIKKWRTNKEMAMILYGPLSTLKT